VAKHIEARTAVDPAIVDPVDPVRDGQADEQEKDKAQRAYSCLLGLARQVSGADASVGAGIAVPLVTAAGQAY
jgi:hypothetical protein